MGETSWKLVPNFKTFSTYLGTEAEEMLLKYTSSSSVFVDWVSPDPSPCLSKTSASWDFVFCRRRCRLLLFFFGVSSSETRASVRRILRRLFEEESTYLTVSTWRDKAKSMSSVFLMKLAREVSRKALRS